MRALTFSAIVVVLFVLITAAGSFLIEQGYGLPTRFDTDYTLEELGLLAGVGKVEGRPVVYEWPVAILLRPGETRINIKIINFNGKCPNGGSPITIKVYANGVEYTSNTTSLSAVLNRNSIFLILKIRIVIKSNCVPETTSTPIVIEHIESSS